MAQYLIVKLFRLVGFHGQMKIRLVACGRIRRVANAKLARERAKWRT